MPTLSPLDNEMPDIDPDALTVNLSGRGPDEEDLVKAPSNVRMPEEHEVVDFGSGSVVSDEEIDEPSEGEDDLYDDERSRADEEEIREIEALLRKKKSDRMRSKKARSVASGRKVLDPIVIGAMVLSVVIAVLAILYFAGVFESKDSIGMTVEELSKAYSSTTSYSELSKYGFAFPTMEFYDDADTGAATATPATESEYRNFSGYFENSLGYYFAVGGVINRSDSTITTLKAKIYLNSEKGIADSMVVFSPLLQSLYPEMTIQESVTLLQELAANKTGVTVKGNYALALMLGYESNVNYAEIYITSKSHTEDMQSILFPTASAQASVAAITPAA